VDVEDLSEAERALWDAFPRAQTVDLGGTGEVRAEVVAALLLAAQPAEAWRVPAVRLTGARITGTLDLSFAEVRYAALLRGCVFAEPVDLYGARLRQVNLARSRLPGLRASDAQVDGLLWLEECRFDGPLQLVGTLIDGALSLRSARLTGALRADALTVARTLDATDLRVTGEVMLRGARVGGALTLDRAHLANPGAAAVNADGIVLDDGLFGQEFVAEGEVRLPDARVARQLVLSGAHLSNPGGKALNADRLRVDGAATLDGGFRAEGQVSLRSAAIGGTLMMRGARLDDSGGMALNAHLITIGSSLRASSGFHARGRVSFDAAQIHGSADFHGARLVNPGEQALSACRATVTGGLFCDRGFRAEGQIRLIDSTIGASAEFTGARLSNPGGRSLTAYGLSVGSVLDCCGGFRAEGRMSFAGARIGGEMCFDDARISAPGEIALGCRQVRATVLRLTTREPVDGTIDLRHTRIEVLRDDPARWPAHTRLDGFTYETIETPGSVGARLGWLEDTEGYHPQPYEQLAAAYRAMGRDAEARTVQLARQRRRRRTLPPLARAWGFVQEWTVGYGYRPLRAALWLAALLVAGTAVFGTHHPAPLHRDEAPDFNPPLYTLDLLLPVISLGQESAFNPRGGEQWLAALLIAAGWVLATTIVAGASRVLSRQ
jgi:uncharacterized protein YjbI with pentapeptide repeats